LQQSVRETDKVNNLNCTEISYYATACALKQNESRAEEKAVDYITWEKHGPGSNDELSSREYYFQE
jgi:hypothetical protein